MQNQSNVPHCFFKYCLSSSISSHKGLKVPHLIHLAWMLNYSFRERMLVSCTSLAFFLSLPPFVQGSKLFHFPTRMPEVESDCCTFPPNVGVMLVGVWLHLMRKMGLLWTVKFSSSVLKAIKRTTVCFSSLIFFLLHVSPKGKNNQQYLEQGLQP